MFPETLENNLATLDPKSRAIIKASFLAAARSIGREICAKLPPGPASTVQNALEEQLAEIAVRLAPELRPKKNR